MHKFTNSLSKESSPYLLQHAHNPVNWVAWSNDVFEQAKRENKLVLISVGYSACHWCHVMEHECFEDEEVAALMNKHFINVKVDREERPDVDQVYMTAVQLITQKGGWPLNCFTLPDGRPVYGGTYFPKEQWMHILRSLEHTFVNDLEKVQEYAENLHKGIQQSELIDQPSPEVQFNEEKLHELVARWSKSFDWVEGGPKRAPKFPLPNNYEFLLQYGKMYQHEKTLKQVELTLDKMALGGIYDQVGGGFTRYSVDMLWKVPHFEKMLYDNGQLLSLYSNAFKHFKKPLYKRIVDHTVDWLQREMLHPEGCYFAALDADSEGEEGKFYCWNEKEFDAILEKDVIWAKDFYNLNQRGYWEDDKYIPLRTTSDLEFCSTYKWTMEEFEVNIARINEKLLDERSHRIRPGLDHKCLTSWNALLLTGFCDAFQAFEEVEFKQCALKIGKWICQFQLSENGKLLRNRTNGNSNIDAFLEDYAAVIQAFISLYEITLDDFWIEKARLILDYTIEKFQNQESKMFYFTEKSSELIVRKMDLNDNVIPASNSIMANNLWKMGSLFYNSDWKNDSKQMLTNIYEGMETYGSGYSNWAILAQGVIEPFCEIVITGPDVIKMKTELQKVGLNNVIFAGDSDFLPISTDKKSDQNLIYTCFEGTCLVPVKTVEEAIELVLK